MHAVLEKKKLYNDPRLPVVATEIPMVIEFTYWRISFLQKTVIHHKFKTLKMLYNVTIPVYSCPYKFESRKQNTVEIIEDTNPIEIISRKLLAPISKEVISKNSQPNLS